MSFRPGPEFDLGPTTTTTQPLDLSRPAVRSALLPPAPAPAPPTPAPAPPAPPPAPLPPEPAYPQVLIAVCVPPAHECDAPRQRALVRGLPILVLHLAESATLRLVVHKPLELTHASRERLLSLFLMWATVDTRFDGGHRAVVDRTSASFIVPRQIAQLFRRDVLAALAFERVTV